MAHQLLELPGKARPSHAASTDLGRPIICHGYIAARGDERWLYTTDSYVFCALRVNPKLKEGFVPIGALKRIEMGRKAEQVNTTSWRVFENDSNVLYDCASHVPTPCNFPDPESLGLWKKDRDRDKLVWDTNNPIDIGLNPDLITKLGKALGAAGRGLRFSMTGPLHTVHVTPLTADVVDRARALLMPIRLHV